ncbi:MAG: mechanosensitive ion channel domain-containing protein [Bacteroidales bacterium]|jgi:miniconductance mechanosensitive channel
MGDNLILLFKRLSEWLETWGLTGPFGRFLHLAILLGVLFLVGFVIDRLSRGLIKLVIHRIVKRTETPYDDILMEKGVFRRIAHFVPAVVVYYMLPHVINGVYFVDNVEQDKALKAFIILTQRATSIYMIIVGTSVFLTALKALNEIYTHLDVSGRVPINGYIQVVKFIILLICTIWILSEVFGFQLKGFFTGLGAFMAVLVIVFRDTLLGLMASIQLSVNKMVRVGDWVTIPSRNADGTILDITVNTVKVENWDKTITTMPTYSLVSESVQNWRGMEESNGRRIKRFVNIDMGTVHICSDELLEKLENIHLISDYVKTKREELSALNKKYPNADASVANGIRLTNLGVFRKYLECFLKEHPDIQHEMTTMVRQLQPTDRGIPIEIYGFTSEKAWEIYENIQSDIFDHVLAVIPEFELRVFQNPTGADFKQLARAID